MVIPHPATTLLRCRRWPLERWAHWLTESQLMRIFYSRHLQVRKSKPHQCFLTTIFLHSNPTLEQAPFHSQVKSAELWLGSRWPRLVPLPKRTMLRWSLESDPSMNESEQVAHLPRSSSAWLSRKMRRWSLIEEWTRRPSRLTTWRHKIPNSLSYSKESQSLSLNHASRATMVRFLRTGRQVLVRPIRFRAQPR